MDAAEIVRLRDVDTTRELLGAFTGSYISEEIVVAVHAMVNALLDALEQARKERDTNEETWRFVDTQRHKDIVGLTEERDAAQQSAKDARALLLEAKLAVDYPSPLHARIEAFLEPKV